MQKTSTGCGVDGGNGFRAKFTEVQNVSTSHCLLEAPARVTTTPQCYATAAPDLFLSLPGLSEAAPVPCLLQSCFPKTVDPKFTKEKLSTHRMR